MADRTAASTSRASTTAAVDDLVQLSFAVMDALARAAAEHDLSVTQLRMLGILRDRSPSMADLAERLHLDRSSVTGLIDRAERRGLVARRASADDARVTLVDMSDAARLIEKQLAPRVQAAVAELIAESATYRRGGARAG